MFSNQLIRDGDLTRCDRAHGAIWATLPLAIRILSLQANEAEVAATFARHVLALINMGDEKAAFGTGPSVWTSIDGSDLLGCAFLQCANVTLSSLSNKTQTGNYQRVEVDNSTSSI